jgi:hypothetical protein
MRDHPRRYAVQRVAVALVGVVLPLLLGLIAVRFAVSIPWPDLNLPSLPDPPNIPWPDIDLPSVPFPDLPDWQLPEWLRWILNHLKYVWPIGLALLLALGEIDRRKKQDRLRAERAAAQGTQPAADQPDARRGRRTERQSGLPKRMTSRNDVIPNASQDDRGV